MNEYFHDILKPALKALKPEEMLLALLMSLVPVVNFFTAPGYFFSAAGYSAQGHERLPRVRLGKAFASTIYTYVTFFLLGVFLWAVGIAVIGPVRLMLSIARQAGPEWAYLASAFKAINSFSEFIVMALFFFFAALLPIIVVRFQVYQYYSRILDLRHMLRLALTKEYLLSLVTVNIAAFALGSAFAYFAFLSLATPGIGWVSLVVAYISVIAGLFLIFALAAVLYGRTFYILETKYKIDHIPEHAKSEIRPVELPELEEQNKKRKGK